jgi:hypothetical protein
MRSRAQHPHASAEEAGSTRRTDVRIDFGFRPAPECRKRVGPKGYITAILPQSAYAQAQANPYQALRPMSTRTSNGAVRSVSKHRPVGSGIVSSPNGRNSSFGESAQKHLDRRRGKAVLAFRDRQFFL